MFGNESSIASAVASVSSKATYGGTFVGIAAFLQQIDIVAWIMVFATIFTAAVNYYFKKLENKREQEKHELEMSRLRQKKDHDLNL